MDSKVFFFFLMTTAKFIEHIFPLVDEYICDYFSLATQIQIPVKIKENMTISLKSQLIQIHMLPKNQLVEK